MLSRRIARALFCSAKREVIPEPPRFSSGELEPFKLEAENMRLYDGYSLDELYGVKRGVKHPPAVRAEMTKDNVAAGIVFVVGMGILTHINTIFKEELNEIKGVESAKMSRKVMRNQE